MKIKFTLLGKFLALSMMICLASGTTFGQTYCIPTYTDSCVTSDDYINNFAFNSLTNLNSGCNGNPEDYIYYGSTPTTTVQQGNSYGIAMQSGPLWKEGFGVWIDYNQDGDFVDSFEFVYASPTFDTSLFSGTVSIPANALTGITRLRVRCKYGTTVASSESCINMTYGETEDYDITITTGTSCTNPPTAGSAFASVDSTCAGTSFTLVLQGNSSGTGQTYQWQSSTDSVVWADITGANGITYSATQTASTYYRCMVTCGTGVASTPVFVNMIAANQCYCIASHSVLCSPSDNIDTVIIVGTTLNNPATGCSSGTAQSYTVYSDTGSTTATLTQGTTYTLSVTSTDNSIISVWIDYDQNGIFDASEWQQVTTSSTPNISATTSLTVPFSSLLGKTRMRIRSRVSGVANGATDACTAFGSGETEDYTITIIGGSACNNPPTAGTVASSANPACPGKLFTLSLTGGTSGSGQTYQWQSSSDGISFNNIPGATSSTLGASQNDTTFYQCIVTCGASANSTVLQVNMNSFSQCYCDTLLHGTACGPTDNINAFEIISTTLNNSATGCTSGNGQAYTVYPGTGNTTAVLQQGISYTFSVTSTVNSIISVWIDFNQNGMFESSEWTQVTTSSIPDTAATVSISIPMSALLGQTGLRVRSRASGSQNGSTDACTEFFSGETEDYTVTITSASVCTDPPTPGMAVTSDTLICSTDSFTLSLSGNSNGTGQTFQWQFSADNNTWNNIAGANAETYITTQTASNYYRCMITCGSSVPSTSAFVNNQQCYCTPTYTNLCSSADFIDDFSFNSLVKQNTGCNGNQDNYILDSSVTTTVMQGFTYNISMQSGSGWAQGFGVWIDYNKNGSFGDSGEFVFVSTKPDTAIFSGTVTIPTGAIPGITRLRVRCSYNDTLVSTESCTNFIYGETEDYNITIITPSPCSDPPTAGTALATPNSVCSGGIVFLSLSGNSLGTGQTYQWQSSPDNISFSNMAGSVSDTATAIANSTTYYRCVVTCGTSVNSTSAQVTIVTLNAGTASGPAAAIGNEAVTYNLSGNTGNIQWQSSPDGITFTNVTGGTGNPQNLVMPGSAVNDTLFIRARVSGPGCSDVFSNAVITVIECATPYNNGSSSGDFINNVIFGTINNFSTIDSLGGNVQDFKGTPAGTTHVCKGVNYELTVSTDTGWTQGKAAWIDFNNNGSYNDPGELVFGPTPTSKGAVTDTVLIPATAVSDTVKMRIICLYNDTPDVNPCFIGPYAFGEIEEYSVIINPTPDATITASGPLTICQGNSLTLTTGSGNSYLWGNGASTQSISVNNPGNYSVTITNPGNCSSSDTVTVTVNPSPAVSVSSTDAACGGTNGTATAMASGSLSPYSYLWSNNATSSSVSGLAAGTYFVTVTDANGCTATSSASVNNVGGPSVAVSSTNVDCNGGNNGSANAVASAGTTPYTYIWSDSQTTANATGLSAGTYTVSVSDANNCIASSAITITQPALLVAAPSTTNVTCNGGNNGSANANPAGGTSPYSYIWSNGQTGPAISGLIAGTYSLTVTDSKSCTSNASIIITEPSAISAAISSTSNISCSGGNDGNASVSTGGGTGPYTYLWSGGQTTPTVNNISAGSISVTVTDMNGCTATDSSAISEPSPISLSVSSIDAACGVPNGSATASASGGTGLLNYIWNNGQFTATATGLSAGNYSVTVNDINNCSQNASVAVNNAGAPSIVINTASTSCFGTNDGSATASVTGGTSPFTYQWSNGQTTSTASGFSAGICYVTVTGNDGCSGTSSDTIGSPAAIISTALATDVNCNSGNNGTASVNASGGNSPYSYLWSDGQTSTMATGLSAGFYSVIITDNSGCSDSSSSVMVNEPSAIVISATSSNANCGSSNGSATAIASGGAGGYSYIWSNGQNNSTATGLSAGSYSVSATDSTGCSSSQTISVSNSGAPLVTVAVNNVFCNGGNNGSATANATGGVTPYNFIWSDGQSTNSANGLTAGTYTVTVTDNNSCATIKTVTITEPSALSLVTSSVDASCGSSNGSASANLSGGVTPYQYSWSGGESTPTVTGLSAGAYSVTVVDANGCLLSDAVNVSNAGAPAITISSVDVNCSGGNDGNATVIASGGATPYSYLWSDGQTTATVSGLIEGNYSITVTDAVNCQSVENANISSVNQIPTIDLGADTLLCLETDSFYVINSGSGFSSYLWSDNSTGQMLTVNTGGTFSVTVTDANGCSNSDSVNISFQTCTGINELSGNFAFSVFPNPNSGIFEIVSQNSAGSPIKIKIYNVLGEKIYESKLTAKNSIIVNLKNHGSGIYFVQLINGEKTINQRIIVE